MYHCSADPNLTLLLIFMTTIILFHSAGYLKDTQEQEGGELEVKKLGEEEDLTITKRESTISDPSQRNNNHSTHDEAQSAAAKDKDEEDDDAVPEEFIAYLNEK